MLNNVRSLLSSSLRKNLTVTASGLIALSATTGFTGYEATKEHVTVIKNGEKQEIRTHANTVAEVLEELDIHPRPEDYIFPSVDATVTDDLRIVWQASRRVTLTVNGIKKEVWTTAKNVKELLAAQHIAVGPHDRVLPSLDADVQKGMNISFEKAFPIQLNVGGKQQQVWATSTTVADFLKQHNITLNELDRVEPSLHEKIKENMVVKVIKVQKVTDVVEEAVDFAVVTRKDDRLPKGEKRVISPGQKGIVSKQYEVVLENGKKVSRTLVKTKILQQSKDRVVVVGTNENALTSRSSSQAAREIYVTATAYTAYCGGCSGRTSTGINLRSNPHLKVIAVDPRIIPLGSKVYVEGYGYAIAADTGSGINGYEIDVFFPEKSAAFRWGARRVKVRIID
ncbi:G5 and 3D domain-containing protein [Anoxybacillus sp. J5B_2022]|uniref:G5 and 3D domain-containing protein n=1 Tax=Anoxybacillus sp. J5B_2022 TaxID=3003246 RepID=UPI002286B701|nr:G5 and 3D domain-containing protein [Anoxybacillus sp. J5B_2022]MCZ0756748.1 ubiquitin-like domain-containing protein [Anoxybacillus sp. J5B_2022]